MESGLVSNREFANLLWLGALTVWLLFRPRRGSLGSSLSDLLPAFLPIAKYFVFYAMWVGCVVSLGARLGFWNTGLIKHTVLWLVLSGFGLLLGTADATKHEGWFRRAIFATVGATAVLEFVLNLKSFPLLIEIILLPVLFLAIVLPLVAREPEHKPIRSFAGWVSAVIGFAALGWTVLAAIDQWDKLDHAQLLLEAVLPLWLTLGAMCFLYPFALFQAYEQLFKRMRWRANGKSVWRQQLAILIYAGPRLSMLRDLRGTPDYDVVNADGFQEALRAIRQARQARRAEEEAQGAAARRLVDNAGLDGWGDDGQRLDQREFAETRKALQWLATCHMGHYRGNDRYRPDLLTVVEPHFTRDGLPEDHGIVMEVADDGGSWYAYRRTVSGWCFGVGAAGPPPDQWCYDGPSPPSDFPTEQEWSQFGVGKFAEHW